MKDKDEMMMMMVRGGAHTRHASSNTTHSFFTKFTQQPLNSTIKPTFSSHWQ